MFSASDVSEALEDKQSYLRGTFILTERSINSNDLTVKELLRILGPCKVVTCVALGKSLEHCGLSLTGNLNSFPRSCQDEMRHHLRNAYLEHRTYSPKFEFLPGFPFLPPRSPQCLRMEKELSPVGVPSVSDLSLNLAALSWEVGCDAPAPVVRCDNRSYCTIRGDCNNR